MILQLHEGLAGEGAPVPLTRLCAWFGVPRRTVYYRPTKAAPKIDPAFSEPIKKLIEEEPSFGYRTVAHLLGFNKNTVQRIFQLKGWQVRRRPVGARPRVQALPSLATAPNQRWSTDMARVWAGKDGWATLALVMDCHTREQLGWHLSRSGKASTAASALEQALIARFGTLGKVETPFLLRSDKGLVFRSRKYTKVVRNYGLNQEFITPHCPQQNGMMERLIRSLKEQCVHRRRFESLAHASRAIGDWIQFYNHRRPHWALRMRTPAQAFELGRVDKGDSAERRVVIQGWKLGASLDPRPDRRRHMDADRALPAARAWTCMPPVHRQPPRLRRNPLGRPNRFALARPA